MTGLSVIKSHSTFGDDNRFKGIPSSPGPGNYEHSISDSLKVLKDLFSPWY